MRESSKNTLLMAFSQLLRRRTGTINYLRKIIGKKLVVSDGIVCNKRRVFILGPENIEKMTNLFCILEETVYVV